MAGMKKDLYRDLAWLPPCPPEFNRSCRVALEQADGFGAEIQRLAGFALDDNQLIRLHKTMAAGLEKQFSAAPLIPFRLGLAGNGTHDFIGAGLIATAARHGLALDRTVAGYDQVLQDCMSPDSPLNRAAPQAVLIALDWRALPLRPSPGDAAAAQTAIAAALDYFDTLRDAIRRNSAAVCIVQNLAAPAETAFGSLDRKLEGTLRSLIDGVNDGLAKRLRGSPDALFDVAGLAETVGLANWHSPSEWNSAKLPFAQVFLPLYCDHVCRILAAQRGLSRRCLVLDLDKTLWGGVIGDDGFAGHPNRAGRRDRRSPPEFSRLRGRLAWTWRRTGGVLEKRRRNRAPAFSRASRHASPGSRFCRLSGKLERQGNQYRGNCRNLVVGPRLVRVRG